jgi:putative oxidoreductase
LLVLRVMGLALAVGHGWEKVSLLAQGGEPRVLGMIVAMGLPAPRAMAWMAGISEVLGGIAVAVGFHTRVAALFPAATMAVALFGHHRAHLLALSALGLASTPIPKDLCRMELALAYLLPLVAVALLGAGRLSLDARRRRTPATKND